MSHMNRNMENIVVRIDPELRRDLEQIALQEDRPMSSWVRRVLRSEVRRRRLELEDDRVA
jgi:predicted transcriptional regulator